MVTLQPHVDVVHCHHCIVHDPDQVLLGESLLLTALAPLLLHLQSDPLHHTPNQLGRIGSFLGLSIADIEKDVDPLYLHHCALLLQTGPGNADVYLLNVAETQREGQSQLVDEGGLQGYVFDSNLSVQQSDIQTVLETVNVLAQVRHQHALNDILHIIHGTSPSLPTTPTPQSTR